MFTRNEKNPFLSGRKLGQSLAAAAVSALALASLPASAQTGGTATGSGATASGAPGVTSSGSPRIAGATANGIGVVSRDDSKMMTDLAHANFAEIETGRLALEKSQSDPVKKFAQQMIDDHTAAQKELQALAQAKGVKLPEGADMKHKTMAAALKVMTGAGFDSQYLKRAGVSDHQETIELLQKVQKGAKDPELKAMAGKMMPTVQHHFEMAQQSAGASTKK